MRIVITLCGRNNNHYNRHYRSSAGFDEQQKQHAGFNDIVWLQATDDVEGFRLVNGGCSIHEGFKEHQIGFSETGCVIWCIETQ